jgi:hypothetical protein
METTAHLDWHTYALLSGLTYYPLLTGKGSAAMPLLVTPSYQQRLIALSSYASLVANLAVRIAQTIRPATLAKSAREVETKLFDHLEVVGRKRACTVTRLSVWLFHLFEGNALQHADATDVPNEVACIGGASGVPPK